MHVSNTVSVKGFGANMTSLTPAVNMFSSLDRDQASGLARDLKALMDKYNLPGEVTLIHSTLDQGVQSVDKTVLV